MDKGQGLEAYLAPTYYIDSDHPLIVAYARNIVKGVETDREKAVRLYYAVRDDIYYDPYNIEVKQDFMKASNTLARRSGYCVAKAVVLAAVLRAVGIPSRLGFADVKNHLSTERLTRLMGTDVFVYHGYAEVLINGVWLKATPTFNLSLCEKFGVRPLDFDGRSHSLFHEYDTRGKQHMEYIRDHGTYADLPVKEIFEASVKAYPLFFSPEKNKTKEGRFEDEAR